MWTGIKKAREVIRGKGFSREYINWVFKELFERDSVLRGGKANSLRYMPAGEREISAEIEAIKKVRRILENEKLQENIILNNIRKSSAITKKLEEKCFRNPELCFY